MSLESDEDRLSIGARLYAARKALRLIAGKKCENLTVGECRNDKGRTKTAKYTAFRWCNACIAREALEKSSG